MLWIHMGFGKTGSSFLQSTLYANRTLLKRYGILYPDNIGLHEKSGAHHLLSHQWGGWLPPEVTSGIRHADLWQQLRELSNGNETNVLVSSEAFSGHSLRGSKNFPHDLKHHLADTPVRLVFYIREQSDYLESLYRQFVKAGMYGESIKEFLREYSWLADYSKTLDPLAESFGDEALVVRVYDRDKMENGSIFHDFLKLFDIPAERIHWEKGINTNPSLSNDALLRAIETYKILDKKERLRALSEISRSDAAGSQQAGGTESILSSRQRQQIIEQFRDINHYLGKRYFGFSDTSPFD